MASLGARKKGGRQSRRTVVLLLGAAWAFGACSEDVASGEAPDVTDAEAQATAADAFNADAGADAVVPDGGADGGADGGGPRPGDDWLSALPMAPPITPAAHPSDAWFGVDDVLDVEVTLAPDDWDALRAQTRTLADIVGGDCLAGPAPSPFTWFEGTVRVGDETLESVGVRKKGFLGSLSGERPALKLRFDRVVEGQRLGGVVSRMTLNNVQQDASKLNTCLAYGVFAAAGVPAPRCHFARVTVNGEWLGLYVHVDEVREAWLERTLGAAGAVVVEGTLSDVQPAWQATYDTKLGGEAGREAVDALVAALEPEGWDALAPLADVMDVDRFMTFWAVEALVGHWDGYSGNRNNHFLVRPPGERIVFVPWGADAAFAPFEPREGAVPGVSPVQSVMAAGVLAHRLYGHASGRARYAARMRWLLETVWDEEALLAEVDRMAALVQAHARPEAREEAAADAERIRAFIGGRRAAVTAELEPEPREWPWPLDKPAICWQELGAFDVAFETTWGSNGSAQPLQAGESDIGLYTWLGQAREFAQTSMVAGWAEDDEWGRADLTFLGMSADGVLDLIVARLAPQQIAPGSMRFDDWYTHGFRLVGQAPDYELEWVGRLGSGGVEFEEASFIPGSPIRGRMFGTLYSLGGYESGSAPPQSLGPVVINEIASAGEPHDWFELLNASDEPVDLSAYVVADDVLDASRRVPFPEGTVLAPGEHRVFELDKDAWPGFALGSQESLALWLGSMRLAAVTWPEGAAHDGSYARLPDRFGHFQPVAVPTPGLPNE